MRNTHKPSKRGLVLKLITLLAVLSASFIFFFAALKAADKNHNFGLRQLSVVEASDDAQKALLYLDVSAQLSAQQAVNSFAGLGGADGCIMKKGFSVWFRGLEKCLPNLTGGKSLLKKEFNAEMDYHSSRYTSLALPPGNYDITLQDSKAGSSMIGVGLRDLEVPIKSRQTDLTCYQGELSYFPLLDVTGKVSELLKEPPKNYPGAVIMAEPGQQVIAASAGTISETGCSPYIGKYLMITNRMGITYTYGFLSQTNGKVGDGVYSGQIVGSVDKSKDCIQLTEPKLYFGISENILGTQMPRDSSCALLKAKVTDQKFIDIFNYERGKNYCPPGYLSTRTLFPVRDSKSEADAKALFSQTQCSKSFKTKPGDAWCTDSKSYMCYTTEYGGEDVCIKGCSEGCDKGNGLCVEDQYLGLYTAKHSFNASIPTNPVLDIESIAVKAGALYTACLPALDKGLCLQQESSKLSTPDDEWSVDCEYNDSYYHELAYKLQDCSTQPDPYVCTCGTYDTSKIPPNGYRLRLSGTELRLIYIQRQSNESEMIPGVGMMIFNGMPPTFLPPKAGPLDIQANCENGGALCGSNKLITLVHSPLPGTEGVYFLDSSSGVVPAPCIAKSVFYGICVKTDKNIRTYDHLTEKYGEGPLIYRFGIEYPSPKLVVTPPPVVPGTPPPVVTPGSSFWPVNGPITTCYSLTAGVAGAARLSHTGIDFGIPEGSEVKVIDDGLVADICTDLSNMWEAGCTTGNCCTGANSCGRYGTYVVIKHSDTHYSRYSHLSSTIVAKGDTVTIGQVIALSGNSGCSSGPHLDFRTSRDQFATSTENPFLFIPHSFNGFVAADADGPCSLV